ncbi:MAG: hypothetical protein C0597_12780 [Marinilabiliales bacterium]|nr:MAG: hypothetical protein C0597_12780 [Marinilabiliales bacterium]
MRYKVYSQFLKSYAINLLFLKLDVIIKLIFVFKSINNILFVLFFTLICLNGKSQIKSVGIPNITNFSRQNYHASTQNWSAIQDKRGIMYFGNNDGLLEFDGVNWRLIQMPNSSVVRSIAADKLGNIYVGAFGEFGLLKATPNGKLNYTSLVDLIPGDINDFGDIWKIHETDNGIIFQSFTEIFLYHDGKIKVIAQKRDFHFSFFINNEFYITERNKGLLKLRDEKLIPVKGGDIFNNDIWTMLPIDNNKILIGTLNHGLFILENEKVQKWNIPANNFLKQNQIYCGVKVKDHFAIGTILNGLLIIDKDGTPVQHINREKGLQNNTVLSIYADNYDNLWLGLDNGIYYVAVNSPFTNIVNESKIGAGYVSFIYQDKLYLGTNQGLFYKKWVEPIDPLNDKLEFKIVENTQGQVWDLFEYNNKLFCGHNNGTYIVDNDKAELISDVPGGWLLFSFPDKENIMLQGTYTGLLRYEKKDNTTWDVNKISGFSESCRVIESYLSKDYYTLWISHGYKGIYKVDLSKNLDKIGNLSFYNSANGLSTNFDNNVIKFYDEIIFTNSTGIYSFDNEQQTFVPNKELNHLFGNSGILRKMVKDNKGQLWFIQDDEMGVVKRLSDGNYKINRIPYKSFVGSFVRSFEHLLPYNDESVIVATEDGFSHLSTSFIKEIDIPFNTLIRSIETTNDSLFFGGAFTDSIGLITIHQMENQVQYLAYKSNNIKFEFSATDYEHLNNIRYKYYLEGFEEEWSEWTDKTYKEYTNLREGDYIFHLKAMNVFDIESETSSFQFFINPPWYRSIVAYSMYLLLIAFTTWIVVRIIRRRIDREKKLLQLKQKKELHQQKINHENEVLSAQQEIVKLRNAKLRVENERNKAEVELKTKELASYAMQVTQKNESLFGIKEQLKHISQKVNPDAQKYLQKLIKNIEQSTNQKDDWEKFEGYFDQVYEDFTRRLRDRFPNLTPNDIKLCAYLRMNLSTKEIAPLLNISVRGVEVSRYRLRKKLQMPQNENLIDFMMNL